MSKKSFKGGFDLILGESLTTDHPSEAKNKSITNIEEIEEEKIEKPVPSAKKVTLRLNNELLKKTKDLAYWERITMTELISRALDEYINNNKEKLATMYKS